MGKIGDVYYVVGLDTKGIPQLAKKEGAKAGDSFGKGMSGSLKKTFQANKGGVLGMLGLGAGLGVGAVALSKVVDFMGEAVDAASDLNEAVSKSDAVFKDSSAAMQEWADGAAEGFGQSKRQALEAAGTFGNLIQAFGIGADKSAEMSKALVELASDLASFNNTSVDEAIVALRAGLSGEAEPLKRYGVALNDVRLKEEALRLGLIKTTKGVLPIAIKTQAAYSLILKDTALAQGDFERTSDGLANTQKSLTAAMEDAQAAIGEQLLPVMVELAQLMRDEVVPGIVAIGDALKDSEDELVVFGEILGAILSQGRSGMTTYSKHTERELEAANKAHERSVTGIEGGLRSVRGDLGQTAGAVEDLGEQAEDTADLVVASAKQMRDAGRDLKDAWLADALQLVSDYFDPIEARSEQLANKQEIAALRATIASKDSTDAQIADAKRRLVEISRSNLELFLELAASGKVSRKEINTTLNAWTKKWRSSTGQARSDLQSIVRQLVLVKLAAMQASGALNFGGLANAGRGRHAGGPVTAGQPYVVGEKRPELFVPDSNGYVMPSVPSGFGSSSSSSSATYNVTLLDKMEVRTPRDIGAGLRMLGEQGHFGRNR